MLETRWNFRVPMELTIKLGLGHSEPLQARTRDVSFNGMFVYTDRRDIPQNTSVEVEFNNGERSVCAPAVVVRSTPEGLGVTFPDADDSVADALSTVMEQGLGR